MKYDLVDGAEVWKLSATYGFPLDFALPILAAKGLIPTWDQLLQAAKADGTNMDRLGRHLMEIIGDAYPINDAVAIRSRMTLLLKRFKDERTS